MTSRMGRRGFAAWLAMLLWSCAAFAQAAPMEQAAVELHKLHERFTIESRALGETRRINVYAPPGYEQPGNTRKYTTLYLLDGGVAEDYPHLSNAVDRSIAAGAIEPVLVIGIENTERRRDMTGPTTIEEDRKIAARVGGSARFRAFVRDELIPQVERRLRSNGRRALIGESLAGLFVVETFLAEPKLFEVYVAISPSLWWNDRALVRSAAKRLRRAHSGKALLLYSADEDNIAPETRQLADALKARARKGLRWDYRPRPDLTHDTIYLGVEIDALRWALPAESE